MLLKRINALCRKYLLAPQGCMFCGDEDRLRHAPFCKECFKKYARLITDKCTDCDANRHDCRCFSVIGCDLLCRLFDFREKPVRNLIYKLKREGRTEEFKFLAARLADTIDRITEGLIQFDCVCFVPRRAVDKRKHGYDHAEEIAKPLATFFGIPCLPLLVHTGAGGEQKRLSRQFRGFSTKDKFRINKKMLTGKKLPYSKIILVDDVVTTGSTMSVCALQLKAYGATLVCGAFIAHTPAHRNSLQEGDVL